MIFSLIDPFSDCQYQSLYLARMVDWAERLGTTRFQILDQGKFVCHVRRCDDDVWRTSDAAYQHCELMTRSEPQDGERPGGMPYAECFDFLEEFGAGMEGGA